MVISQESDASGDLELTAEASPLAVTNLMM